MEGEEYESSDGSYSEATDTWKPTDGMIDAPLEGGNRPGWWPSPAAPISGQDFGVEDDLQFGDPSGLSKHMPLNAPPPAGGTRPKWWPVSIPWEGEGSPMELDSDTPDVGPEQHL